MLILVHQGEIMIIFCCMYRELKKEKKIKIFFLGTIVFGEFVVGALCYGAYTDIIRFR